MLRIKLFKPKRKISKVNSDSADTSQHIITLIRSRPEIWDENNNCYTNKKLKAKSWCEIAMELNIPIEQVKLRWTRLRDVFRKHMKRVVIKAKDSGDLDPYVPVWKHFNDMQFLRESMLKKLQSTSDLTCLDNGEENEYINNEGTNSNTSLPSTVHEDSEDDVKPEPDMSTSVEHTNDNKQFYHCKRQKRSSNDIPQDTPSVNDHLEKTNEDYHFFMSILPSVRNIPLERKNILRMEILKLIVEEENFEIIE